MSGISIHSSRLQPSTCSVGVRAPFVRSQETYKAVHPPTSPDTSLPWSQDAGPGGWSAKMFVHQMLAISQRPWNCSDTERLLSRSTAPRLPGNPGRESSLSEHLAATRTPSPTCFMSQQRVSSILRRHAAKGRSFRVFWRDGADVGSAMIAFGTRGDCASVRATKLSALPVCLPDGLVDFLKKHAGDVRQRLHPRKD